eukprot:c18179_g1_i2.p1 GENE.c18179_g1_i2~~c18179_g1_i2.p1  ORF type:complete len:757 (+),score=190.62 c18179_g1_i2:34-2304(+)
MWGHFVAATNSVRHATGNLIKRVATAAIDTVAPNQKPEQIFQHHWTTIKHIHNTSIPETPNNTEFEETQRFRHSLEVMVKMLVQEFEEEKNRKQQAKRDTRQTLVNRLNQDSLEMASFSGPCFDILISQDVILVLIAAAQTDTPSRIAVHVVEVLAKLIELFAEMLLPHKNIHQALNSFLKVMMQIVSEPDMAPHHRSQIPKLRIELARLVLNIAGKLEQKPSLTTFFFFRSPNAQNPEFVLLDAISRMAFVEDEYEADFGARAFKSVLCLESTAISSYLCLHSNLAARTVRRLAEAYSKRPTGAGGASATEDSRRTFPNRLASERAERGFDRMLRMFDDLCLVARDPTTVEPGLGFHTHLARVFKADFVQNVLIRDLTSLEHQVATSATDALRELLFLQTPMLVASVVESLLEDSASNEAGELGRVMGVLVARIQSPVVGLSSATLCLFESLLALGDQRVWDCLVLRHLNAGVVAESEQLKESGDSPVLSLSALITPLPDPDSNETSDANSTPPISRNHASSTLSLNLSPQSAGEESAPKNEPTYPSELMPSADVLYHFIHSLPPPPTAPGPLVAMSTNTIQAPVPYETYLADSEQAIAILVECHGIPRLAESVLAPTSAAVVANALKQNSECYPAGSVRSVGPFLEAVLTAVECMLDHKFAQNIALSGVVARLAQDLNPLVHSFVLNPYLPLAPGCRSLPRLLRAVIHEARWFACCIMLFCCVVLHCGFGMRAFRNYSYLFFLSCSVTSWSGAQ